MDQSTKISPKRIKKKDLIIGKTELDITDEILEIINKDVKEFKIK